MAASGVAQVICRAGEFKKTPRRGIRPAAAKPTACQGRHENGLQRRKRMCRFSEYARGNVNRDVIDRLLFVRVGFEPVLEGNCIELSGTVHRPRTGHIHGRNFGIEQFDEPVHFSVRFL